MEHTPDNSNRFGGQGRSRIWSGIILIAAGLVLLAYKMGAPIPHWIFTWPVLLITIGLITGIKSQFQNPGAFIMLAVGGIFLADQMNPTLNFHKYIMPAILIAVGLIYVLRPKNNCSTRSRRPFRDMMHNDATSVASAPVKYADLNAQNADEELAESLDISAVLGGVKKIIVSKNFKGGEINCFMGGAEINLSQADILHPVTLEVNNIFAGTKLVLPPNWYVKNDINAVFAGVEDKRHITTNQTPDLSKSIRLTGNCVFGGIEISNY
ncbi:MAG: DUF5668 domain-containing protein [Ginsengibacter sp.]